MSAEQPAPNPIITAAIDSLAAGGDLSAGAAEGVLAEIMAGRASDVQTSAFLITLRAKGETVEELVGLARTMRSLATPVEIGRDDLVDTAGTGGGASTFNVSTTAALVAAAAGCAVAKHGNRSATSRCGSADVLEALGVRIDLSPQAVAECIEEVGFGFMFAPAHHPAMRHVVPVRKALAVRTTFNFLGPLTNPAGARRQLIGVSDPAYTEKLARALAELGCDRALVVTSDDGLDELSAAASTTAYEVAGADVRRTVVDPEEAGVERVSLDAAAGGEPEANARLVRSVLAGEDGAARQLVLLNAGAAIHVGGDATLPEGVQRAREAIDSGRAAAVLERLVELTGRLAG